MTSNTSSSSAREKIAVACGSFQFDSQSWLCVQTLPQAEDEAKRQLERQGWVTYFPRMWKITRGRRGRFDWLFPRYGFVQINLGVQSWTRIQHTIGVSRVVTLTKDVPAFVSQADITRIRSMRYDRVNVEAKPPVQDFVGERFSVLDGPWQNKPPAVCTWSARDRIKLLHTFFGRETQVEYSLSQVKLVDNGCTDQADGGRK